MGVELDTRYQTEAYDAIKKSILDTGKAGIILPTGTGKTYLALKLIEDNLDKKQILYVSPSPIINIRVRKIINQIYDKEKAKEILLKVKFTTYSGLNKRYKHYRHDMREYNSDVIILDEIHRSGAEEWGKAVDYLLESNQNAKLLGMTATPLRTDGQNMIEKRCGKTAYELKISDAVARGILSLPLYITSRYIFEEDVRDIEERVSLIDDDKARNMLEEKLRNAKKQLENAEGLKEILSRHLQKNGKYFVFCNAGDNLEEIIEKAKSEGWFDTINRNQTLLSIEANKKDSENVIALKQFERKRGKDLRILFSKNMLNEGVRDEEITGEIMMRPTRSYIIFIQQLGRILSRDRKEIPVVLDLVGNIHYFKEFKLEVKKILEEAERRGDKRYSSKVLEQFRIIEEQEEFIRAFEQIEEALNECINQTTASKTLRIARILKANGVDLSKIQLSKSKNGKQYRILLKEIQQEGIDIAKIIEENNLDEEFEYGKKVEALRAAYNGRSGYAITEAEKEEARNLGLIPEQNKSAVSETLEIARILSTNGVDLNKIKMGGVINGKRRRLLLREIQQEGIDIAKIIEENNLDGEFPYGARIMYLKEVYKGERNYKMTEAERAETEMLGLISKDSKSSITEVLEIVRILIANGVNLSKIQLTRKEKGENRKILLGEIEQEGIDIRKIIEEYELDEEFPYGQRMHQLRQAYRGTGTYAITEKEKEEAGNLGLIPEQGKSAVSEALEVARILKVNGVDLSKVKLTKTENKRTIKILLKEVKQGGIDIRKIIEEYGLDENFEYGKRISALRQAYRGTGTYKITEEEREEAKKLGLISEDSKSAITEVLEIARILIANGVNLSKIQLTRKEKGENRKILLGEIEQDGIDVAKIIEEYGLDENFEYGKRIKALRLAYNGSSSYRITDEEKAEVEELGLIRNRRRVKGQEVGQASFDATVEECDDAQAVLENLMDKQLEGEIVKDE